MALIHDLRLINGVWSDTHAWDILNGNEVADTITIYGGNDQVIAGGGNDVIYDFNSYTGGPSGSDIVRGGFGNDTIFTSLDTSGNLYDGGADFDTVNFVAVGGGVNIDLQTGLCPEPRHPGRLLAAIYRRRRRQRRIRLHLWRCQQQHDPRLRRRRHPQRSRRKR